MRKITPQQISLFFLMFGLILVLGVGTAYGLIGGLPLGDFRGVTIVIGAVLFIYLWAFAVYRLFLHFMPLQQGELAEGSRDEFAAQVNILFYLMLFNSLIRTHFLPVPLMRLVYQALGAKLGANCIIGHDAVLFCHAIEGRHFALSRIRVGDNVTIGATAVVMSGVTIGDGAIVSAGALVLKDAQIGPGEVWGGVPAKRLK
jgi:acetyltransferase-like isoleucine patch superfamily enzyme